MVTWLKRTLAFSKVRVKDLCSLPPLFSNNQGFRLDETVWGGCVKREKTKGSLGWSKEKDCDHGACSLGSDPAWQVCGAGWDLLDAKFQMVLWCQVRLLCSGSKGGPWHQVSGVWGSGSLGPNESIPEIDQSLQRLCYEVLICQHNKAQFMLFCGLLSLRLFKSPHIFLVLMCAI